MAAVPATITDPPAGEPVRIRPITVDEYHRMLETGILYEREPVELLDGQLIAMPPEGPLHADVASALLHELVLRFADRATVRAANPLTLRPLSEPQPDIALVRRRNAGYRKAHPGPQDVFVAIEISQTSLRYDRGDKLRAYARAGIAETWIVDLVNRRVEVYTEPREPGYGGRRVLGRDDTVAPRAFPGDAIAVASFLP